MVYRAERLYSALGDAQKIFKHIAQLIYDKEYFNNVLDKDGTYFNEQDRKIIKKRE